MKNLLNLIQFKIFSLINQLSLLSKKKKKKSALFAAMNLELKSIELKYIQEAELEQLEKSVEPSWPKLVEPLEKRE